MEMAAQLVAANHRAQWGAAGNQSTRKQEFALKTARQEMAKILEKKKKDLQQIKDT